MFTLKYVNFISYPIEFDTEFSGSVAPLHPSSSNGRSKVTRLLHGAADNRIFLWRQIVGRREQWPSTLSSSLLLAV